MPTINTSYALATALQQLQANLSTADTDGNKTLSSAEFTAAAKADPNLAAGTTAAAEFAKLDTDKDGQLTSTELTQGTKLESQIYSVLLQGQEIASGGAFLQLLGSSDSTSSLFGGSTNDFSSLTSSLLGGGSSTTSLISLLSGQNTNTSTLAALFGGGQSTADQVSQFLTPYLPTDTTA